MLNYSTAQQSVLDLFRIQTVRLKLYIDNKIIMKSGPAGFENLLEEMIILNTRIFHLERSNKEMKEYDATDKELDGYIKENQGYIVKYKLRIQEIMDILITEFGLTPESLAEALKTPGQIEEDKKEKA